MKATNLVIGAGMLIALAAAMPAVSADTYTAHAVQCLEQNKLNPIGTFDPQPGNVVPAGSCEALASDCGVVYSIDRAR
jgi:hypothetical protein